MQADPLRIIRTLQFTKSYRARIRTSQLKKAVAESIQHFREDHSAPELRDHPLRDSMKKLRAFSITEEVRIIYLPTKKGVIFLDIGTHEQVYHK